jgi:hypothetical protein
MGADLSGIVRPEYLDPDGEFSELVDAEIPRVDLVDKAANGMRFLIAKRADGAPAGLLDPEFVRGLVAKAEPDPSTEDTVTMSGSPAAIVKLIHQAAQRPAGEPVAKETSVEDDLDPTEVLAEPEVDAPGMPTDPGSPAWESIDAATARKWTSILARARNAVGMLADREWLESAAGDDGDGMQAMDLEDAACAIDYAISVLAPFAVAEQSEVDCADDMAAVGKALGDWDSGPLDTIEALGQVAKAGRVLSSANEAAIRGAVESLQKVLASLPAAPTASDDGQPVAKEQEQESAMTVTATAAPEATPTAAAADASAGVAKADDVKPSLRAVYDAKGHLIGVIDPADLTPIADAEPDEADDAEPAAPETPDLTPAPADEVGTPADAVPDDVAKQTDDSTTTDASSDDVLKGIAADLVKAHFDAYSAAQQEVIAKQAETLAAMAETVETLKGQVAALEEQPAEPKVFTRGAVPPAHHLRGQDRGAAPVDTARAAELRKGFYSPDAGEQNRAAIDMQGMAIAKLREIHERR